MISASYLLNACANLYDTTVNTPEGYHTPTQADESFDITGRFSVINSHRKAYGNFTWSHKHQSDQLALTTPLGSTVALISIESRGAATLRTPNNLYSGTDLNQLFESQLGFTLPIDHMYYWIQGLPLPQYKIEKSLTSGFHQLGWDIEYLKWQDINHPQIVQLSNPEIRIKLLISSWQ